MVQKLRSPSSCLRVAALVRGARPGRPSGAIVLLGVLAAGLATTAPAAREECPA